MMFSSLFRTLFPRRRAQRVVGSLAEVYIDGVPHHVQDWSETGLGIEGYEGSPAAGERVLLRFVLPLTSEDVFEFETWAEVIHNDRAGIGMRYLSISDDLASRLRAVLRVMGTTDVTIPKGAISYD